MIVSGRSEPTKGKEPIGSKWGLTRWGATRLKNTFDKYPAAGAGICFGPGRGPHGEWLTELEGDGPLAEESKLKLFGGEVVDTVGWSATRGGHDIYIADGDRLLKALAGAGAQEKKGFAVGVWHLAELPNLEIRVGGTKPDGTVKQVQSVIPPTLGTDGKPRQWRGANVLGALPEAAYLFLEGLATSKRATAGAGATSAFNGKATSGRSAVDAYVDAAVKSECDDVASTLEPGETIV